MTVTEKYIQSVFPIFYLYIREIFIDLDKYIPYFYTFLKAEL